MTAKHTPGPWRAECDGLIVAMESNQRVAFTSRHGASCNDEFDGNACLLAASPDLLTALQDARAFVKAELDARISEHTTAGDMATLDETDGGLCGEAMDALARIDAAIAKATGA